MNLNSDLPGILTPLVFGFNHHSATINTRDAVHLSEEQVRDIIPQFIKMGNSEVVVFSTCNRTEVYATSLHPEKAVGLFKVFFQEKSGLSSEVIENQSYVWVGTPAIEHLFKVTASLDSMVVGENQILGQVKRAYQLSVELQAVDISFNFIFQSSFKCAKRIRTETAINQGAVSISYAAVELARKVLGSLHGKKVGIVGSGEMGELTASHLVRSHIESFVFFNRSPERAQQLVEKFGGEYCSLDNISDRFFECDLVVSSTGARDIVITKDLVKASMKRRGGESQFLIDIAAPRDIADDVGDLANVFLFTIDDLKKIAEENKSLRNEEAEHARKIIENELESVEYWRRNLGMGESMRLIREKIQLVIEEELSTMSQDKSYSHEAITKFSHRLVGKIAHIPLTGLKDLSELVGSQRAGELAQIFFQIQKKS